MKQYKIYLDVCCLNRPFDDQGQDRIHLESEAILSIIGHIRNEEWVLLGSDAIDDEISRIPDDDKRVKVYILAGMHAKHISINDSIRDRSRELHKMGFKPLDAVHIASAEHGHADILLTTDDALLAKASRHRKKIHVSIVNPLQWALEVIS